MERLAPYPSAVADDAAGDILARSRPPDLGPPLRLSYSDYPSYPGYQSSLSLYESRSRSSQQLPLPASAGPSDTYRSEYLNSNKPYGDLNPGSDYLGYSSAYGSYPYARSFDDHASSGRNLYQKDDPLDLQNRSRDDLYGRYEASSSSKYGLNIDTKDRFAHFTLNQQHQPAMDPRYGRVVPDSLYKLTDSRDPIYPNLESGHHYEQTTGTSAYNHYLQPESMHFNGRSELDMHSKYQQQVAKADASPSPSPSSDRDQGQDSSKVTKEGEVIDKLSSQGANTAAQGTEKKKRRSRWEPVENCEGESNENIDGTSKRRKSRWSEEAKPSVIKLPDFVAGGVMFDREVLERNVRLLEISKRLQTGQVIEDKPDGKRSPSPEPVYDSLGMRINTKESRARERLLKERAQLIAEMTKKNRSYKPPADYKISKFQRKLFVPVKEYPGYNFVGLIIGPRGLTLKRMEKESGARILLRGKGSSSKEDQKSTVLPEEDLHVLIEGETEESVEKAALLVGKLLVPVEDDMNEHKRAQLRVLAAIEGTLDVCRCCGETGHLSYTCPLGSNKPVICHLCGNEGHIKSLCPKVGKKAEPSKSELAEGKKPEPSQRPVMADGVNQEKTFSLSVSEGSSSSGNSVLHASCLPSSLDDEGLAKLFSLFGDLEHARVVRDPLNGSSKGYGYVKFSDATAAAQAAALINGYIMDGCKLEVKVASNSLYPAGDAIPMHSLRFGSHLAIPSEGGTSCLSPYNFYDPSANHF